MHKERPTIFSNKLRGVKKTTLVILIFYSTVINGCSVTTGNIQSSSNYPPTPLAPDSATKEVTQTEIPAGLSNTTNRVLSVALLLPFYANELEYDSLGLSPTGISEKSSLALKYYNGVLQALDSLDRAGIKINVTVFDTRKDTGRVRMFFESDEGKNAQLIVGPVSNHELQLAAMLMDEKKQILISPLSSSYNITTNHPSFYLANAGLKTHCTAMAGYINEKYPGKRILMLYRRSEGEGVYASYFKSVLKRKPIELTESPDSNYLKCDDFFSAIDHNIIIIPSFDEEFINLATKNLNQLSENYSIIVFGMPTWKDIETLRLDYLQKLNTHISSSFFTDTTVSFSAIRGKHMQMFNTLPSEYSYQGYNLFLFCGLLYKQYGDKWNMHIDQPFSGTGVNFRFERVNRDNDDKDDFIENKNVFIMGFKNNNLVRIK